MPFSCYICPKEFGTVNDYITHLRNIHVLIPPCSLRCNCGGCIRTFSDYNALRKHLKRSHEELLVCIEEEVTPQLCDDTEFDSDLPEVDPDESVYNDPPAVDEFRVSQAAFKFLLTLTSNSIPLSTTEFVKNSAREMINDIVTYLEESTKQVLLKKGLFDDPESVTLMEKFNGWKNPFSGIDSHYKLQSYMKSKNILVQSQPHSFEKRWDSTSQGRNFSGNCLQTQIENLFYYIPIADTLTMVLQQRQSLDLIIESQTSKSSRNLYEDWFDGENGQKMQNYAKQNYPESIHIFLQLYFDEVETVNPLGSKTGIHKVGAFYFVVKNFPPAANSSLHNIHLLALANAHDLKTYTCDPVLEVILQELQTLHDVGFQFAAEGKQYNIRVFLAQIVGDNLGMHALMGFTENFSKSNYPCDLCLINQEEMQNVFRENMFKLRTKELYDQHVHELQAGRLTVSECGIKRASVLTKLPYYHPMQNESADPMHDCFEGILPREMKWFLHHIIYECKAITVIELNRRIKCTDFGNESDRPSSLLESRLKTEDSALGQRSAQMLTLFYFLPLLLADVIRKVDPEKLRLYCLLRKILEIVLSPCLSPTELAYMADLIEEHHCLIRLIFPEKKLIFKHHRMVHYPRLVNASGPLLRMMVMRFEAKHNFFKRVSNITCNFKNICYSLAQRHQIAHAMNWTLFTPLKGSVEVGRGQCLLVSDLEYSNLLPASVNPAIDVFIPKKVCVYGQNYYCKATVLVDCDDEGQPSFGLIEQICIQGDDIFLIMKKWVVHEFSPHLHSFGCSLSDEVSCVKISELMDYKPFFVTSCANAECRYTHIVLRHNLCSDNVHNLL